MTEETEDERELVKEGVPLAVAERIAMSIRQLDGLKDDLNNIGIIKRTEWDRVFGELLKLHASAPPALESARCFQDQWPEDED